MFQELKNWRARRVWLRDPQRALKLLSGLNPAKTDAHTLGILAWLELTVNRNEQAAGKAAQQAVQHGGDLRYATAVLAELAARQDDYETVVELVQTQRAKRPNIKWYELTLADALLAGGRYDDARTLLESSVGREGLHRHAVKRLAYLARDLGDRDAQRRWYAELIALAPDYMVYSSDYVTYGQLLLDQGDEAGARRIWLEGVATFARNPELRQLLSTHFGETEPAGKPIIAAVDEQAEGVTRIPIKTPWITSRSGLLPVIDPATKELRQPDDVLVLAESPAAAGQARIVPLELVEAGPLAKLLCRFVGHIGPLHSPEGMEGAIMETGRPRIVLASIAGAASKVVRKPGWFYEVTGPPAAMIDDVGACAVPNDHHVLFGPGDPDGLASDLAVALGCQVAVVDANNLSGAWVVGASGGVDRKWLEQVMSDNPAGNEDQQTPVVLVKRTAPAE